MGVLDLGLGRGKKDNNSNDYRGSEEIDLKSKLSYILHSTHIKS